MHDNKWTKELPTNSAIMFVEQKLLPMCLNEFAELGLQEKCGPLIDIVWIPKQEVSAYCQSSLFEWENNSVATHIWITKQTIEKNEKYRIYMCCRAVEIILTADNNMSTTLANIESVQKYLRL